MTLIDIGFYFLLCIIVFKEAKGGSLVTIKNIQIGSFRGDILSHQQGS